MLGGTINSFNTIAACGKGSNILHNILLNHKVEEGKTMLVDAGCLKGLYCSDMTRVFPINGKFTEK